MAEKNRDLREIIGVLLEKMGRARGLLDALSCEEFGADGSERRFFRIVPGSGAETLIAISPPDRSARALAEARSSWLIGRHLRAAGVPVPELYGFDEESGLLLCEDLGVLRLHDLVVRAGEADFPLELYRQVVRELARMQVRGGRDFDPAWCWDSPRYDRALMLERESGYFLSALCRDYLAVRYDEHALAAEFAQLADRAAAAPSHYFLHRDFQSRNIMIKDGRVRFIDFQGGRLGPLAYDLASLLLDPYAALSPEVRATLLADYLSELELLLPLTREIFLAQYEVLALQRNLQILGAFAFLTKQRGKPFFRAHIAPALFSLQSLLAKPGAAEYPALRKLVKECINKVTNESH